MGNPAVEFEGIKRHIGACRAVDGVSAQFDPGLIHAILGENGAGKSTLMKLLFGLHPPTEGSIKVEGETRVWRSAADAIAAGLGMVQQHFTLVETLSVIDNIMLGFESTSKFGVLDRKRAIEELEKRLPSKALKLDWHKMVGRLSVGEKQKVEILKLIARDAKILVLDEPTAVLSPQEISGLFEVLKSLRSSGHTIFVITHKLGEVIDHCDTWFVLRAGKPTGQGIITEAERTDSGREALLKEVVRAMVGSEVPPLAERKARSRGVQAITMSRVSTKILHTFDLDVHEGEIVGIAGIDGSGQSEIVDSLIGLEPFTGTVEVLSRPVVPDAVGTLRSRGVALVSEDRLHQSLWLKESVELNAGLGFEKHFARAGWLNKALWAKVVGEWLRDFDVRFTSVETPVGRLSGGNQQKLIFARELMGRKPRLIIAHQPTRGVDLFAIRQIHERLIRARDGGAAVLVISSELDELMALADRIVVIFNGRKTGEFKRDQFLQPLGRENIGRLMTQEHA